MTISFCNLSYVYVCGFFEMLEKLLCIVSGSTTQNNVWVGVDWIELTGCVRMGRGRWARMEVCSFLFPRNDKFD